MCCVGVGWLGERKGGGGGVRGRGLGLECVVGLGLGGSLLLWRKCLDVCLLGSGEGVWGCHDGVRLGRRSLNDTRPAIFLFAPRFVFPIVCFWLLIYAS